MKKQELDLMQCPFHPKYQARQTPSYDCERCWEIWQLYQEWAYKHRIELDDEYSIDRAERRQKDKSTQDDELNE